MAAPADNYPSTLPQPGHNWQINLDGKVIASKSCPPRETPTLHGAIHL